MAFRAGRRLQKARLHSRRPSFFPTAASPLHSSRFKSDRLLAKTPKPSRLLLPATVAMLLAACARLLPTYKKPIARTQFQRVRTTAYTHTVGDHRKFGAQTCIGTTLRYDAVHNAASDWSRWPVGTIFRILDTGEICKVDDIGWALSGRNTIDLYKPTRAAMNAWGTRTVTIEILNWGDDHEARDILSKRSKYRHVQRMIKNLDKVVASNPHTPPPLSIAASAESAGEGTRTPMNGTGILAASVRQLAPILGLRAIRSFELLPLQSAKRRHKPPIPTTV